MAKQGKTQIHPTKNTQNENLRRSMMLARGNPAIFVERPICLALLVFSALLVVVVALPALRRRRDETFAEEGS